MRNILKLRSGTQSGTPISVKKTVIFCENGGGRKILGKIMPRKLVEKKMIFLKK